MTAVPLIESSWLEQYLSKWNLDDGILEVLKKFIPSVVGKFEPDASDQQIMEAGFVGFVESRHIEQLLKEQLSEGLISERELPEGIKMRLEEMLRPSKSILRQDSTGMLYELSEPICRVVDLTYESAIDCAADDQDHVDWLRELLLDSLLLRDSDVNSIHVDDASRFVPRQPKQPPCAREENSAFGGLSCYLQSEIQSGKWILHCESWEAFMGRGDRQRWLHEIQKKGIFSPKHNTHIKCRVKLAIGLPVNTIVDAEEWIVDNDEVVKGHVTIASNTDKFAANVRWCFRFDKLAQLPWVPVLILAVPRAGAWRKELFPGCWDSRWELVTRYLDEILELADYEEACKVFYIQDLFNSCEPGATLKGLVLLRSCLLQYANSECCDWVSSRVSLAEAMNWLTDLIKREREREIHSEYTIEA